MTSIQLPSPRPPREDAVPACPYVGLVPFNERDELCFFGRSEESDVIGANLMASRLTILYAPSGAGKTSVLRAGVLPRLRRRDEDDEELGIPPAAVVYVSAWSGPPLETIADEILRAVPDAGAEASTAQPPPLSTDWLRELLRTRGIPSIYLILDQFEEYFFYHPGDLGAEGLPGVLGEVLRSRDLPVNVLLSIREDALAGLDRFKGYVPHLFDNYLRLSHLRRDAGREAIEGPLDQYNRLVPPDLRMRVEPDLVEAVLEEVRTGQVVVGREETLSDTLGSDRRTDIEAPYLQLVLTRLWEQERAQGSPTLRRQTLAQLGGAQTIVQCHLDNVMSSLAPEQRNVAAAVFHHLVTASGSKIALAAEDLAGWSNLPTGPVQDLLESLSSGRQRILRPIPPATGTGGSTRYEIFHDVMGAAVVDWRRRYVTEQEQAAAERQLVAEREDARAAARTARRRLRRTRIAATSMALLLIIALVLAGLAYQNSQEAKKRRLLSESALAADRNTELSLAKAVQAYEVRNDEDTREAVLTAASAPRSRVVAGPEFEDGDIAAAGMLVTPDQRHVVAYDGHGAVRVVDDTGSVRAQTSASGLTGAVITAAVAPDASRVALATDQGDVAIVDVSTGHRVHIEVQGPPMQVFLMGSGADSIVLIADASGGARTYSAESGTQIAAFPGHVFEVVPTTDGRNVITSDRDDNRLRVWDARTGQKVAESSDVSLPPMHLQPYGSGVVGLLPDRAAEVVIWTWQDGPDPRRYPLGLAEIPGEYVDGWYVTSLEVDEQSAQIRVASEKEVRWYSLDNGQPSGRTPQMDGWIYDVGISQDGDWMATAGLDGLLVWNANLYRPVRPDYELRAHEGDVTQVEFLSAADTLVSRGGDGTVRLWRIGEAARFINHTQWVWGMDLSGDGRWLATASRDGTAYVLDPGLQSEPVATAEYGSDLVAALLSPTDPHHLFTLSLYGSIPDVWEWDDSGQVTTPYSFEPAPIDPRITFLTSMTISRDGETLAAGDTDGAVHLWDARTGKLRSGEGLPRTGQPVLGVAIDPRGEVLATATDSGLRLQDPNAGRVRVLSFSDATTVVFDPSGDHLASMSTDGTVRIWDRQGEIEKDLKVSGDVVRSLAFSSDGTLIAGGTAEGLVQIWNVESGRTVMISRQHSAWVNDVRFLPGDNSTLISASDDSYVARWRCAACTDPEGVIRDAVDWVNSQ